MTETILKLLGENPDLIVPVLKEYINKYKPAVYVLLQELVEVYKDYSNNTEYPTVVAKVKKNMYDAYVEVGFNEDQALALMLNDNLQLMKNVRNISSSSSRTTSK